MRRGEELGLMNTCMEDCLAHFPDDQRHQVIGAWLMLGVEYGSKEFGRARMIRALEGFIEHVREAEPSSPWPE